MTIIVEANDAGQSWTPRGYEKLTSQLRQYQQHSPVWDSHEAKKTTKFPSGNAFVDKSFTWKFPSLSAKIEFILGMAQ